MLGSDLFLFLIASLVLLITPGPAVLYVVARSVQEGRASGFASTGGLAVGSLIQLSAAVLGLASLLAASSEALRVVRYIGATYLIYLGIRTLWARTPADAPLGAAPSLRKAFREGIFVNLVNPKSALFFLAFLPQFVDPARGPVGPQMAALGLLFILLGMMTDCVYAFSAGAAGSLLRSVEPAGRWPRYLSSSVYLGLGIAAAVSGRKN